MEDRSNCGECYFYDDINQPEKKIHCIFHQEWRGQYTGCEQWTPHKNDSSYIKESRAKDIRDRMEQEKQNQVAEAQLEETKTLVHEVISETKKQGQEGTSATRKWAIIGIVSAVIITVVLYLTFR